MKFSSTYKMLLMFSMLLDKPYTKQELQANFKSHDIEITKASITKYINKFISSGINIKSHFNSNKEKIYNIEKKELELNFDKEELQVINDIKKCMFVQKDYPLIKKAMRLFYKIAKHIKNDDSLISFVDFGYYSTLNWNLIKQLENHCKKKDIITIDYLLPRGGNKEITIHTDSIKLSQWSDRMYLNCVFEGGERFSHLPIDRIFMVKKIKRQRCRFNLITKLIRYIVSSDAFKEAPVDDREIIIEKKDGLITLERPIDDEFHLIQRLLYFCPELYYISDNKIKNALKDKLETLKYGYEYTLDR